MKFLSTKMYIALRIGMIWSHISLWHLLTSFFPMSFRLSAFLLKVACINAIPKPNTRQMRKLPGKQNQTELFFLFLPKGMGLINSVFNADSLKKLYVANLGIGHTRYSTSGISELQNCQPFVVETLHGKIAVAHNGELTNAVRLRRKVSISFGRL